MTFWNWRRGGVATATAGSGAIALAPDLAPIELYTTDGRIVGWVAADGHRVTDLLNEQDELRLWRPHHASVGSNGASFGDIPADGRLIPAGAPAAGESGDWDVVRTADVMLAMPPEWRASRQLRLHRRLRRVALTVGPFAVTGNLHLQAGVEPTPRLLDGPQRFLALTEAYLLYQAEPSFEHVVSVAIVNTRHATQLVPLVSLA